MEKRLGVMLDCSRNGVMKPEKVKQKKSSFFNSRL